MGKKTSMGQVHKKCPATIFLHTMRCRHKSCERYSLALSSKAITKKDYFTQKFDDILKNQ